MSFWGKLTKSGINPWGDPVSATLAGTSGQILVIMRDKNRDILQATGTDVPANATTGYAKGCLFIDRDVVTGTTGLYENIGTNTSCNFNAIGAITAGEITLATGSVLLGTAGVAAALDGKGDGKVLIGNGTTMASFALSQDVTMTNAGVVTIAKINNLATAAEVNQVCDGATATATEINYLDITTLGTGAASKAVVLDAGEDYTWPATGILTYGVLKDSAATTITATGAELNYLDIAALGTGAASKAVVLDAGDDYVWPATGILTYGVLKDPAATTILATGAEINGAADLSAQVMVPGVGITAGVGTVFKTSVVKHGDIIKTTMIIDLTGLSATTTADDIIGTAGVSHIGQITAALNGTLFYGQVTCLETPAGGDLDIDFWSATEGTGAYDALVTDLAEVIMRANGGNWAAAVATPIAFTNLPAADKYMYMAVGSAGGAPGEYSAGQFMIELYGF